MYGVLRIDGRLHKLPTCDAASIEDGRLVCYDAQDRVIASYSPIGSMFGEIETLRRLVPVFERKAQADAASQRTRAVRLKLAR